MDNSLFILNGHKGLGTAFWVELFLHDDEKNEVTLSAVTERLIHEIESFEKKYSRFKEDSLLSLLNTKKTIPYDKELAEMITYGEDVSRVSSGIFSLYIKEKLIEKGYGGNKQPSPSLQKESLPCSTTITENSITLHGSYGIDLGGLGKGYLIDKLARILKEEYSFPYFLINGGGDIYVTSNHGNPIELFLEHPTVEGDYIASILLNDGAFCSSSSFKRAWVKDGVYVNHFIANKEVWAASYVIAKETVIADMYATVFCIASNQEEETHSLLAKTSHTDYVVIREDGTMLTSAGFPQLLEK